MAFPLMANNRLTARPPPLWPMVDPHQCAGWLRALASCGHATLEPSHAGVAHGLWE